MSSELFQRAVKLARDGRKDEARAVLKRILALNPRHEGAWLWLVDCQTTEADRIRVLEECLHMIPNSQSARRVLHMLRAQQVMGEAEQEVSSFSVEVGPEIEGYREPSPLLTYIPEEPGSNGSDSSVSPFTVAPEEVTDDELYGAVSNLSAMLGTDLTANELESPIAVDPTQPIHVKPRSSMPSDDELKELFDKADDYQPAPTKEWSPSFSDDGVGRPRRASENIKTRPRSAQDSVPTRPRPKAADLTNRPLFLPVEQAKHNKDEALMPVSGGPALTQTFLDRWLTPKRMLALLAAGAGVVLFLSMIIIIMLLIG